MGRGRRGGGGGRGGGASHRTERNDVSAASESETLDMQHLAGDSDTGGESVAAIQERHKRERKTLKKKTDKMVSTSLRSRKISDPAHQAVLAEVAKLEAELAETHAIELERANTTAAESARALDAGLEALLAAVPLERESVAVAANEPATTTSQATATATATATSAAAGGSGTDALSLLLLQATPSGPTAHQLKALRKKERKKEREREEQRQANEQASSVFDRGAHELGILGQQLAREGLAIKQIPSDGDCLFNAIADQLLLHTEKHSASELRKLAAQWMRDNADDLLPFMPEGEDDVLQRCHRIETTSEWGDWVEIHALSHSLGRLIRVHTATAPVAEMGSAAGNPPINLVFHQYLYTLGAHYNSAVPAS